MAATNLGNLRSRSTWRKPAAWMPAAVILMAIGYQTADGADRAYRDSVLKWRLEREAGLKRPEGWLSLVGLHWLNEGPNVIGTEEGSDVRLPAGSAAPKVGVLQRSGGNVGLAIEPGVAATVDGKPFSAGDLRTDADGGPSKVALGRLSFTVIKRGARYGVRLWDAEAKTRTGFKGLHWFPVNEEFRVKAKFTPHNPPRTMGIVNVLGDVEQTANPGTLTFTVSGKEATLEALAGGDELFLIFRDLSSGDSTYGAGRFLYADKPVNGETTLDFNKAYNPPCAFTDFATCPLPPPSNHLKVKIEAGEKKYEGL